MSCPYTAYAWAMGFIEGDGSVSFDRNRKTRQGKLYDQPVITACCQDREIIERVRVILGGSSGIHTRKRVSKKGIVCHRDVWRWKVTARKALAAAVKLLPFAIGPKRAALQEIIDFYKAKGVRVDE